MNPRAVAPPASEPAEPPARTDFGFPPGAFAVIEIDDEWAGLDAGRGVARWSPGDH